MKRVLVVAVAIAMMVSAWPVSAAGRAAGRAVAAGRGGSRRGGGAADKPRRGLCGERQAGGGSGGRSGRDCRRGNGQPLALSSATKTFARGVIGPPARLPRADRAGSVSPAK